MTAPARQDTMSARRQAHLDEIKARNAIVIAINNQSWGNALTPLQQRAFAEYMRRFNLDISEIDNLGGRPYRNGRYYMRRCAELVAAGRVEWYEGRHIGPDKRLVAMAEGGDDWAIAENTKRQRERIGFAVPEDATFAYVLTVKMKELALPTQAAKYYVPGRKKKVWRSGKQIEVNADPVGDENPDTSVETRAWRRVGRLVFAEIPELSQQEREMEFAADATQEAVVAEAVAAEQRDEAAAIDPSPVAEGAPNDPYMLGEGTAQPVATKAPETVNVRRTPDFEVEDA